MSESGVIRKAFTVDCWGCGATVTAHGMKTTANFVNLLFEQGWKEGVSWNCSNCVKRREQKNCTHCGQTAFNCYCEGCDEECPDEPHWRGVIEVDERDIEGNPIYGRGKPLR